MLLRLAYLSVANVFALLRLLPVGDRDKAPADRMFLAALLHRLPRDVLGRFRLLVRPDTVLRWHRDLLARRHAASSVNTVAGVAEAAIRLPGTGPPTQRPALSFMPLTYLQRQGDDHPCRHRMRDAASPASNAASQRSRSMLRDGSGCKGHQ